ncbi:MAG: hypothetical protein A2147_00970 [Chloroflexi bacterium RBG_16_57_8]|nr:MAG: hypothetical protein A2147_00970 [Chloroflexi bacterium RBG_16_57_8]
MEGSAPPGATLPDGLGGHVDLARFHIDSFFDVFAEFTVSGGYVTMADGTTDYDVRPVPLTVNVPEPSSIAALLTGFAGIAGFGIRRRSTR